MKLSSSVNRAHTVLCGDNTDQENRIGFKNRATELAEIVEPFAYSLDFVLGSCAVFVG